MMLCASLFGVDLAFKNSHVGEIAVFLIIVKTKSYNELVGDLLSAIFGHKIVSSARRLIEKSSRAHTVSALFMEIFCKIGERTSAVNYILNDNEIFVRKILSVKVKHDVHVARRGGGISV